MRIRLCRLLCSGLLAAAAFSQSPPVPSDPLELATGPVKVADSAPERAAGLALLERARQNNNLHAPAGAPFDLKISLTSGGQSSFTGTGEMEEIWLAPGTWRWNARVGDYSQERVFYRGLAYDANPHTYMPLRLHMLRSAVFWPVGGNFAGSLIRTVRSVWNGTPVTCVLLSGVHGDPTPGVGRRWEEEEFCVDPKSGLLQTYSVAPGIYDIYDYNSPLRFHGSTLARQISVVENGVTVLQARIESLQDPGATDPSLFTPDAQMLGPGPVIQRPMRLAQYIPLSPGARGAAQPVVILAELDAEGKVLEAEAIQTSDAGLSAAALEAVRSVNYGPAQSRGGVPWQREAFVNVHFLPAR